MAKPIINVMTPFDATEDYYVQFSYSGNLPYNNRMVIYEAASLSVVYDHKYETDYFIYNHLIPANTLVNGNKYAVQIQVFDSEGEASPFSDKYYFYVFSTPTFGFENVTPGQTIDTSFFTATLTYDQDQLEDLASYRFYLYDQTKTELYKSDILFDLSSLDFTYKSLENQKTYYFRATGETERGIDVDTGYVSVNVRYEDPTTYSRIYAENDIRTGIVEYRSNIVLVEPDRFDYEYDASYIILENDEITYSNLNIPTNATFSLKFTDGFKTRDIFRVGTNERDSFLLSSRIYDEGQLRFKLTVFGEASNYVIYSDSLNFDTKDIVTIHIRRVDGVYGLYVFVDIGATDPYNNIWIGRNRPMSNLENYDWWLDTDNMTVHIMHDNVSELYQDEPPEDAAAYSIWIGGDEV